MDVQPNQAQCDPLEEAFQLAGKALFGDEWLAELPPRVLWLVSRYRHSSKPYDEDGRAWTPPALQDEVDRAYDLVEFQTHQWDEIQRWWIGWRKRWMRDGSLPSNWNYDQPVPARLLEEALKQDFGLTYKLALWRPPENQVGAEPRKERAAGGRPEEFDWQDAEMYAMNLLREHGDPNDPKNQMPKWRTQEDLVRAVADYLDKHTDGHGPDDSTIRRRASGWLRKFREEPESAQN